MKHASIQQYISRNTIDSRSIFQDRDHCVINTGLGINFFRSFFRIFLFFVFYLFVVVRIHMQNEFGRSPCTRKVLRFVRVHTNSGKFDPHDKYYDTEPDLYHVASTSFQERN